jgi:hypothetical protein
MTSFDWSVLTAGLAAGLGVAWVARTGLRRRGARRDAQVNPGRARRRIDVVAIKHSAGPRSEHEHNGESQKRG